MNTKELSPFAAPVQDLIKGAPISIGAEKTVQSAAELMKEKEIGSLLVIKKGRPVGIITKTDMVDKVVARGGNGQISVGDVMTNLKVTIEGDKPIFEAVLAMIHYNVGHLPVMKNGEVVGMVSERDWLTFQKRHPLALIKSIETAPDVESLAHLRAKANTMIRLLFREEMDATALTLLVTEINDRVLRRLLNLSLAAMVQKGLGTPPVPFAWVSMGSEGRKEQTFSTDQDNGIIFAPVPPKEKERVQKWFLTLAEMTVEGLVTCGFPRCTGNVMASNPDLCQGVERWKEMFTETITQPEPKALMDATIRLDFRAVYGDESLADEVWNHISHLLTNNRAFIRSMAGIVMTCRPPVNQLGWKFRNLFGLRPGPIDIKREAMTPIVNAVRLLSLASLDNKSNPRNRAYSTHDRLEAACETGEISEALKNAAISAFEHVLTIRVRGHFHSQERGKTPDNAVNFNKLNSLEVAFLKDALHVIDDLQKQVNDQYGGLPIS